jgi:hypothetical protein
MNRVRGAPAQNLPRPIVPPLPYRGIARGALQVGRLPAHGRTAQACSGRRGIYPALAVPHLAGGLDALQSARVDAVNVLASPVISPARASIIDRLNRARLPAIYEAPEIALPSCPRDTPAPAIGAVTETGSIATACLARSSSPLSRDPLEHGHSVFNHGGLADHNACAVINHDAAAEPGRRIRRPALQRAPGRGDLVVAKHAPTDTPARHINRPDT